MVFIRKKCGGLCFCINYRKLNYKTIPDKQSIPKLQNIVNSLDGQEWFSMAGMSKACHQSYIIEDSRKFTVFSTPWTPYECIRIPYGLTKTPPFFQQYMKECLGGLRDLNCIAYLEDNLIYGQSFEEHLENLEAILKRLKEKGIKLNAKKCHFFKREVKYLGCLISKDGHRSDPPDLVALEIFPAPCKTVSELGSLLGFVGYYRYYVKIFSKTSV